MNLDKLTVESLDAKGEPPVENPTEKFPQKVASHVHPVNPGNAHAYTLGQSVYDIRGHHLDLSPLKSLH